MSANDLFWLAVNAYHEARGETDDGIRAVCFVVLNRAKKRKLSIKDVVLQPMQFSWANGGARPPIKEYGSFVRCMALAEEAIEMHEDGQAFSADHYFADYIKRPVWADKMTELTKIGKHYFLEA